MQPRCEILVRETHMSALETDANVRDIWSGVVAKLPRVPPNNGVKSRKNIQDHRPARTEMLDAAISQFPYVVAKIDGVSRLGMQTSM